MFLSSLMFHEIKVRSTGQSGKTQCMGFVRSVHANDKAYMQLALNLLLLKTYLKIFLIKFY